MILLLLCDVLSREHSIATLMSVCNVEIAWSYVLGCFECNYMDSLSLHL